MHSSSPVRADGGRWAAYRPASAAISRLLLRRGGCLRGIRSAASSTEVLSAHTASKAVSQAAAALLPAGRLHLRPSSALALELVVKFKDPATSSGERTSRGEARATRCPRAHLGCPPSRRT